MKKSQTFYFYTLYYTLDNAFKTGKLFKIVNIYLEYFSIVSVNNINTFMVKYEIHLLLFFKRNNVT